MPRLVFASEGDDERDGIRLGEHVVGRLAIKTVKSRKERLSAGKCPFLSLGKRIDVEALIIKGCGEPTAKIAGMSTVTLHEISGKLLLGDDRRTGVLRNPMGIENPIPIIHPALKAIVRLRRRRSVFSHAG